jgi:signal transduction histidine kinase
MLYSFVIFLFLGVWSHGLAAAPLEARVFELSPDTDKLEIDGFHYLVDPTHQMSLGDVQKREDWTLYEKAGFSFGFAKEAYWITFRITDKGSELRRWITELHYAPLDHIDFYVVDSTGNVLHKEGGDLLPFRSRDIKYRTPTFVFNTGNGKTADVFLRIRSESSLQGLITLWKPERFIEKASDELFGMVAYLGIMFAMMIYNFFVYLIIRDRSYLYYVLTVLFHGYTNFSVFGLAYQYVSPEWPWLSNNLIPVCIAAATVCGLLFAEKFLLLPRHSPFMHRLFLGLIGWGAGTIILSLFSYRSGIISTSALTLIASPALLIAGIICLRKGYRPARYFTMAFAIFLVGLFVHQLIPFGILKPGFFTSNSNYIGSALELLVLSIALGHKMKFEQNQSHNMIRQLNSELQEQHKTVLALNEQLEKRVEEQTRDIRAMLQHIHLGIFTIVGDGRVHKDYSAYLEQIFEASNLGGRKAVELLFEGGEDQHDISSQVDSVLQSTMGEPALAFDMNEAALTKEIRRQTRDGQKILEIDWSPMMNRKNLVEKILVTVRDVTQFRELQSIAADKKKELDFIAEIVPVSREQFARFVSSSEKIIEENERLIRLNRSSNSEALKIIFINLHTLKGTARTLGFKRLTELVHNAEHFAGLLQKGKEAWNQARLLGDLVQVKESFEYYRHVNDRILERNSGRNNVEIEISKVEGMLQGIAELYRHPIPSPSKAVVRSIDFVLSKALYQPAQTLFKEIFTAAQQLARDLNKETPLIQIEDQDVCFSPEGAEILRNIFSHLIRNSMDHGIESREERLSSGKSATGTLRVSVAMNEDGVELRYRDDGRGLALHLIKEIALIRGLIDPAQNPDPHELALLIFEPGFSTTQSVTEISGRGVGMSAIKSYAEKGGGSLSLEILPPSETEHPGFRAFEVIIRLASRHARFFSKAGVEPEGKVA